MFFQDKPSRQCGLCRRTWPESKMAKRSEWSDPSWICNDCVDVLAYKIKILAVDFFSSPKLGTDKIEAIFGFSENEEQKKAMIKAIAAIKDPRGPKDVAGFMDSPVMLHNHDHEEMPKIPNFGELLEKASAEAKVEMEKMIAAAVDKALAAKAPKKPATRKR